MAWLSKFAFSYRDGNRRKRDSQETEEAEADDYYDFPRPLVLTSQTSNLRRVRKRMQKS